MSSVWTSFSTLSSLYWTYAYETQPRHLVEVRWISVFFFSLNQQKATTMVSCLYLYLFSVRSSKVFYVQLILVKRWQLKNIKNCNIEVDQMHQLLKTKKIRYSLWATLQFVRIEKLILRLSGSVIEHRNAESEGLRFDSSRGLGIYSLSHARDKTRNIYL